MRTMMRSRGASLCLAVMLCLAPGLTAAAADSAEVLDRSSQADMSSLEAMCLDGHPSLALRTAQALLEAAVSASLDGPGQPGRQDVPALLSLLGRMHDAVAEYDAGGVAHRLALDNATALHGPGNPALIPYLAALAVHHIHIMEFGEASRWFETAVGVVRQALGPSHLNAQAFHSALASLALQQQDLDAAADNATRALNLVSEHLWPEHPARIRALGMLGAVALQRREPGTARRLLDEAVQLGTAVLGAHHPEVLQFQLLQAGARAQAGDLDAAAVLARETLRLSLDAWGPAWPRLVMQGHAWPVVEALHRAGRLEEAIALQRMRLALWDAAGLARHLGREEDRLRLATLLLETRQHAQEALEILSGLLAPSAWDRLLLMHSPAMLAVFEADLAARVALARALAQSQAQEQGQAQAQAQALVDAVSRHLPNWPAVQARQGSLFPATPEGTELRRLQALRLRMQLEGPQGVPLAVYTRRLERIHDRLAALDSTGGVGWLASP
ncbi:MAG: tetratricopeptide repeat protein [Desulfovibrio sp.]|nr:tetratricopeptide repeat protein [Desulfovibrio sp.]